MCVCVGGHYSCQRLETGMFLEDIFILYGKDLSICNKQIGNQRDVFTPQDKNSKAPQTLFYVRMHLWSHIFYSFLKHNNLCTQVIECTYAKSTGTNWGFCM